MKSVFVLLLAVFLISCGDSPEEPDIPYREGATVLTVKGMHCSDCERTITTAVFKIDGVEWTRAENELGEVAYTGSAKKAEVAAAIREVGYEVVE